MPYLIDGHNLIARLPDLQLSDPDDEAQLVLRLRGFAAAKRKQLIVVFDKGLPGGYSAMSTTSVKVIFAAAYHTSADAILLSRIRQVRDAPNWTVVSSDQVILQAARQQGMKALASHEFAQVLVSSRPTPLDKSEAPHVIVSQREVEELLNAFEVAPSDEGATAPTPPRQPPQRTDSEATPPRSTAIKSKRHTAYAKDDDVPISDQDIAAWLSVFERAPAPKPPVAPDPAPRPVSQQMDDVFEEDEPAEPPPPPPPVKRPLQKKYGEPHLSADEIAEWLRLFGEDGSEPDENEFRF
jgi:hypothetical protein